MLTTTSKLLARNATHKLVRGLVLATSLTLVSFSSFAEIPESMNKEQMEAMQKVMKEQMSVMTPDLQKQVQALSPQMKKELMKIIAKHPRRSKVLTLRQVMHEVLSDYQSITTGIITDNLEQAADSARRLASHRLPVGGLLPYMKKEDINDDKLGVLVPFNDAVEGNALRLAAAADAGNVNEAASYLGKIAEGCVSCHQVFRGQPGLSDRIR